MHRFFPGNLIRIPPDEDAVPAVIIIGFQNETIFVRDDEFEQINLLVEALAFFGANDARPGNVRADGCALRLAE